MTFKYPEYSALFNIFENEKSYDDATQTHSISFGPTMKMSSYLLAFVISDYQIDSAQGLFTVPCILSDGSSRYIHFLKMVFSDKLYV